KASKYCDEKGNWFQHPESNRTWSNYTMCISFTKEKLKLVYFVAGSSGTQRVYLRAVSSIVTHPLEEKCLMFLPLSHSSLHLFQNAYILYYMAIVGHALSIVSLLISLGIFFYFKIQYKTTTLIHKALHGSAPPYISSLVSVYHPTRALRSANDLRSLSCQRITLHKNLFFSYVLNSLFTIVHLTAVVPDLDLVKKGPVSCKVLQFFHQYMMGCNYFWMLCEGIYLHTLIVVAVFAEEQHLHWYYLLGWGFPLVPTSIHAFARTKYFNDNCWMSVETHLLYIVHGPIMAALLVNLFFLLNIVLVLVTKLRDTHRAESNMYMKAVRATLILVPLLGIQFVIFPWRPENRLAGEIYDYIMHILMHYQVTFRFQSFLNYSVIISAHSIQC
ncbi:unnamed protein product, partial [Ranitomeya imitator]